MMDGKEVAFLAKVTAGFTHEIKNVLAIIKESSGLMEDLLALTPPGAFPHQERFLRAVASVLNQVERGVSLSTRLNGVAHSPDVPVTTLDAVELVEGMAALSERFARLKRVTLKAESPGAPLTVVTSPLKLRMAVFMAMECAWSHMPQGGEIRLGVRDDGRGNAVIQLQPVDPSGSPVDVFGAAGSSEAWGSVADVLRDLGGRADGSLAEGGFSLVLPLSKPSVEL